MDLINTVVSFLMGGGDMPPQPHPFSKKATGRTEAKDEITHAEDVQEVSWGSGKALAKVAHNDSCDFEYTLTSDQKGKLQPMSLDTFDKMIISQYNLDSNGFKKVKPYILGGWTNSATAVAVNYSVSWVNKLSRRVKDAEEARTGKKVS